MLESGFDVALARRRDLVNLETALDVLERLGQALPRAGTVGGQVALTLAAVQDGLDADAVFWRTPGDTLEVLGPPHLANAWYRAFSDRLLVGEVSARRAVMRSFLDPGAKPMSPWPCSVALVCIDRTPATWLAALSFHPRRLFQSSDLKLMLLARQLWLSQQLRLHSQEPGQVTLHGLVESLTLPLQTRTPQTWSHCQRVARLAVELGNRMRLPQPFLKDLYWAGLLHDVGKLGVRDTVLHKTEPLTEEERLHLEEHPIIGDRLLAMLPRLHSLRPAVRGHHERYDGTGFPDRLAGDAIPLQARLVAVADAADGSRTRDVETSLRLGVGRQWDPGIVEQFLANRHELLAASS
jgi:HD domain